MLGNTQYYIDADTCANHAACVAVCPVEAIALLKIVVPEKFKFKSHDPEKTQSGVAEEEEEEEEIKK